MYSIVNEEWELEFYTELPHTITDSYQDARSAHLDDMNMEGSYEY